MIYQNKEISKNAFLFAKYKLLWNVVFYILKNNLYLRKEVNKHG